MRKSHRRAGRRAELGPDQAVGHGEGRPAPRPYREPVARGGNHQRQGDERANADHLKHVESHGRAQADAALEGAGGLELGKFMGLMRSPDCTLTER